MASRLPTVPFIRLAHLSLVLHSINLKRIQGDDTFEKLNSLSFPGYFKLFPSATQERKIQWNAFLLAIMSHIFHFP